MNAPIQIRSYSIYVVWNSFFVVGGIMSVRKLDMIPHWIRKYVVAAPWFIEDIAILFSWQFYPQWITVDSNIKIYKEYLNSCCDVVIFCCSSLGEYLSTEHITKKIRDVICELIVSALTFICFHSTEIRCRNIAQVLILIKLRLLEWYIIKW